MHGLFQRHFSVLYIYTAFKDAVQSVLRITMRGPQTVIAKGDAREVSHTISDSSQYLACIMFINLFSASIKL